MEVIAAAKASGAYLSDDFAEKQFALLDKYKDTPPAYSSMKEDFDAGKPLELNTTFANPLKIAKNHGFKMTLTEQFYHQIRDLLEKH